jgi:5-carboxymethyl-2-hydroxymuconate isomerase
LVKRKRLFLDTPVVKATLARYPVLQIGYIYCIGRNYVEHAQELENEVPDQPLVFLKPTSSVIFEGEAIQIPTQSNNVHHEVELAVAIGKTGKNISEEHALEYVKGYGVGIDVTARDIQQQAKAKAWPWTVAKGFDTFAPLSPFISSNHIGDPQNISLKLTVNGEVRQDENTRLMIFPVASLISYLSHIFTLGPGDVILTGTPKGVSPIQSGDHIEATLNDGMARINVTVV